MKNNEVAKSVKRNNKTLKISLALIVMSALITIIVINKLKVDKPVFFKSYYEFAVADTGGTYTIEEGFLELRYISNRDDERHVVGITFKEIPDTTFYSSEYNQWESMMFYDDDIPNKDSYGTYRINKVQLSCPELKFQEGSKEIVVTEAEVEFSDGLKMDIDLGKIVFYKHESTPVALEQISTMGSSDGTTSITAKLKDDVKIEKIESALFEDIDEIFDLKISYIDGETGREKDYINGETIKENSTLIISSAYKGSDDILEYYTLYDINPKIYFKNQYNDEYSIRYYNMRNCNQYYTFYWIAKYLSML